MVAALRVAGKYTVFASLWILFSDKLVELVSSDLGQMHLYSTLKGLAFVLTTGLLLLYWVRAELAAKSKMIKSLEKEAEIREQLIAELHHRIKNNMQVIMGLVNIASRETSDVSALRSTLVNKLHSMMAVFNVVYEFKDMKAISLVRVLEEYKRLCAWNITHLDVPADVPMSIENITSLLLLVNNILEILVPGDSRPDIGLGMHGDSLFVIHIPGLTQQGFSRLPEDEVIAAVLESMHGSLDHGDSQVRIALGGSGTNMLVRRL